MPSPARRAPLSSADYVRLSSFRYALRRFLHFSESETARLGLTGQQYQAMLIVRCSAERAPVTINDDPGFTARPIETSCTSRNGTENTGMCSFVGSKYKSCAFG